MLRLLAALALAALPSPAIAAPVRVMLLGDSITLGRESDPVGPPYAELLADSLGPGFEVVNVGCGGASSLDWTRSHGSRLCGGVGSIFPNLYEGRALPELPAELVTILLGTNDAIGAGETERVAPSVYAGAIAELAGDLLADGAARVMLMTPPPDYTEFAAIATAPLLADYRDAILALCSAPGDALLCGPDFYTLLQPEDFATGNVHPNASGQAKIAGALHDAVLAAIPEPTSAPLVLIGLAAFAAARRPATVGRRAQAP